MVIGLDIGTTNVKAVAFDDDGRIVRASERHNTTLCPAPGFSEQEPEAVFQNVTAVLDDVLSHIGSSETLHGVVLSSAMHGLMAVDASGNPLTNILLWSDLRADEVARALRQGGEGAALYQRTGVPVHAMSPLVKLIWMRRRRPDIFHKAHKFLGIKDYVWYRLTGKYEVDLSVASATGLMNIRDKQWDDNILSSAGISLTRLPEIVSTTHRATLASGVPICIGASDGALANLGSGATAPGQVAVTVGTSAAIRTVVQQPVLDAQQRSFCYCLDAQRYIVGGASNNGANVLEWLRSALFRSPLTAEAFANQALDVPPGAEGLLFLPWLFGERAPLYDAQAQGALHGLRASHTQAHAVRAAMEGVIFNLRLIAEALEAHAPIETLHASGGFSHSDLWVRMLADIFQIPVALSGDGADASVQGAVRLGREVFGLPPLAARKVERLVAPGTAGEGIYRDIYDLFKRLARQEVA